VEEEEEEDIEEAEEEMEVAAKRLDISLGVRSTTILVVAQGGRGS